MRKTIIAIILVAAGILGLIVKSLNLSGNEITNFNWVHFGILVVPIIGLLVAYSEDYNQRTMFMFWTSIISVIAALPVASLFTWLFSLEGNKGAWMMSEGIAYLITALVVFLDYRIETKHRRQFGLGEYRVNQPV